MKQKTIIILIVISFISFWTYSCRCGCTCDRNLGCKTLTVKKIANDSIILTTMLCPPRDYYSDSKLQDSVTYYFEHYKTDSTFVTAKDSIYKYERVSKVTCDDKDSYEQKGYGCECAK